MYYDNLDSCFSKYLEDKNIIKVNNFQKQKKDIDVSKIEEQIEIINEFHNRMIGYTGHMNKRLTNSLGRTVEQYKIYIKWLSRDIDRIKHNGSNTEFEEILENKGEDYLDRANKCIEDIYNNNYIYLLKRSMVRNEVCLKNVYFNNLRKVEDVIQVININGCSYNMIEMDEVNFLKKLKKKMLNMDPSRFVLKFCDISNLDKDSFKFIISMYNYPYEFMKCCNKYRYKRELIGEEECVNELKKIVQT